MQINYPKESFKQPHTSSDSDSNPDWNEQLITVVRQKAGRLKKITEQDRLERIQDCLNEGADINTVDQYGNTALHTAVKKDWKKIIEFLQRNGARTDICNHRGQTAITLSATIDGKEGLNISLNETNKDQSKSVTSRSTTANEFISLEDLEPSTSRESMLQLRRDLSPTIMFDNSKFNSNRRSECLKRKVTTDNYLNENPKGRRVALDNVPQHELQPSSANKAAGYGETSLGQKSSSNACEEGITHTDSFDGKKTYAASGLKRSLHGTVYQLKHLMLILHRAWKAGYPFRLSTEMNAAEKFDDLVLQYRDNRGKELHRFVQVKHKQDESKEIRACDLLAQGDGEFSVQKYFISWRKIRKHSDFTGSESRSFILCTNIGLDLEGLRKVGVVCKLETKIDEFLKVPIRSEQPPRYKLSTNNQSELHDILKAASDFCKLARLLAQRVHDDKGIDLKTVIFKYYHTALAQEIIDIEDRTFFRNFIENNNLSERARNFRANFFLNMKQLSRRYASDVDIWKSVKDCSLKLSTTFGKDFQLVANPVLTHMKEFTQEFARLLKDATKNNVVKIPRTIYSKQARGGSIEKIVADNIDKLAGHVLIREGKNIKFSSQFLSDGIQSSGNIEEFKGKLKSQLGSKYDNLDQIKFEINHFKTCEEEQLYSKTELPDDDIPDEEISDFLTEFILAVDQPNEIELGEMIAYEIGTDSQFNILNGDFIGDSFQKIMLDWFKHKEKDGTFLSNKDAEDFFTTIELKVSSLVTIGLNLAYPEVLEKYGIKYQDKNEELQRFLTRSNLSETQIFNLIAPKETLLTALRVHQTLLPLQSYRKNDSFIFIRLKTLLLTGIMNRVISAFASPHSHHLLLIDCGSTTKNQISRELWNALCEVIEKYSDKRLIIITQGNNGIMATQFKIAIKTCHEKDEDVSFDNLTKYSKKKLLEKLVINFQGQKKRTSFARLLGIHESDDIGPKHLENLEEIIDSKTLIRLIRDEEIRIGDNLKGLQEIKDYYINRTIVSQVIIKEDALKNQHIRDLFAISGSHRIRDLADAVLDDETSQSNPIGRQLNKFTTLDNDQEVDQFRILCEQNPKCNIHWLHGQSEKLIWKQSLGNITNLVKYRDPVNSDYSKYNIALQKLTEDQLVVHDKHRKIVIISDTAGMGKSTVLTYLAGKMKENDSDLLVISIDLTHYTTVLAEEQKNPSFERENSNGTVDFLTKKLLNLEINTVTDIFKRIITKHGKTALLFDGFDEISPNYEDTVIELLQAFANLPIEKLFVTTRPHTREALETKLNTFSHTMQPFSKANQVEFLTKFWKKRLSLNPCNYMIEERLRRYAEAVMQILAKSVDDWMNELTGVPLQTRMVAEVFGDIGDENRDDFYACKDFLNSGNNEPKLPKKIDLFDLYRRFIDKKYYIYRTEKKKENPTNIGAEEDSEDLREIFLKRHQKLALYTLFNKDNLRVLLPFQREICLDALVTKFIYGKERTGFVTQIINDNPYFIHRTFAEYFVATFLIDMLRNDDISEQKQTFLVTEILLKPNHKTIRAFLNSLLSTEGEALGNKSWKFILDKYCSNINETVFHVAAAEGNGGIIRFFLNCFHEHSDDRKTLINIKDDTGRTAIYIAAEHGHWDEFRLLAQHGDTDINFSLKMGKPALQIAASTGNLDVVKYLVETGANVNSRDNFGFTPIDEGAMMGHLEIVKYLAERGANINSKSNSGHTPAHWASGRKNLDVLKYLVDEGADVNSRDTFGMTPIFRSCLNGNLDIVKYLIEVGAEVNLSNNFGDTPLRHAATYGNWGVVRYLLANGANSNSIDENSWTLLHKVIP